MVQKYSEKAEVQSFSTLITFADQSDDCFDIGQSEDRTLSHDSARIKGKAFYRR